MSIEQVVSPIRDFTQDFRTFARTYHAARPRWYALAAFAAQPATGALLLFRLSASEHRLVSFIARRALVRRYGCDVERGALFGPGLLIAHPVGIVIGRGARTGHGVKLHQHVTLGQHRGGCPVLEDDVYVYAGAVVVGPITVGAGANIGANSYVCADVAPGAVVPAGTRWVASSGRGVE